MAPVGDACPLEGRFVRARDLGIVIGEGIPGPFNAITDVPGVRVGHVTLVRGDGPRVVGEGPVRTGVTVVVPHDGDTWAEPVFAGGHDLNGNGELTGMAWIREAGFLSGPVALTNTHSVGVVRDALVAHGARSHPGASGWALPVVGETWDGRLNDIDGFHVRPQHVEDALASAAGGAVAEGTVGGGTGMVCHGFKGGIGTASRVVPDDHGGWTVGVLVQANYGRRSLLRIDGVPVGREIPTSEVPAPALAPAPRVGSGGDGSILIVIATDAPLLPHQCARVARRAGLGLARTGSIASTSSGDLFLCFATGNRGLPAPEGEPGPASQEIRMVAETAVDPLFEATVEATEEAIVNALVAATTVTGCDGVTAHALPHDRLRRVMARYGREPG
jgi:D-aminopeptidase